MQETAILKKTPLYDRHVALGGKVVDFAGWALPVYYTSIIAEHQWVRESCGIFDVSHLGEIRVQGPGAERFLQLRLTQDMRKVSDGRMIYSLLCDEKGRTIDDILIYRESAEDYYLVVNASNISRDYEALRRYCPDELSLTDQSDTTACVALQGPRSEEVARRVFGIELKDLQYYAFTSAKIGADSVWISRSGYTGEDGFEFFSQAATALVVWDKLIAAGEKEGVKPCGLGARNTLRLEAGNPLYGHELDDTTTPLEAGLGFAVSFDKGAFVGRDILLLQQEEGPRRKIVGFRMSDRSVARDGYPVYAGERRVGKVTSGSYAPTAGASIGLASIESSLAVVGKRLEIEIHGRRVAAEIVKRPFVPLRHKRS